MRYYLSPSQYVKLKGFLYCFDLSFSLKPEPKNSSLRPLLAHLTAGVVVPGGDADPSDEAEDQHDEAEDDEAGGGVAGGPGLSVQQGAHGGHTEVLVTPLQQEVLVVRCSNVSELI